MDDETVAGDTDHWIGDLGHLALADAMLGATLIDLLGVMEYLSYPETPREIDAGLTTKQAARAVGAHYQKDPSLFPATAAEWLREVIKATDLRNRMLHAVALDRCAGCGNATLFRHPRSGLAVDRSEEAVRSLTACLLTLNGEALQVATDVSAAVNKRIVDRATALAEELDEAQCPPQVYPQRVHRLCAHCSPGGSESVTVSVGTAVAILPRSQRALFERWSESIASESEPG